jgi:hypothetical protein
MRVMEARNPTCCIHKSMTPDCKYKVVTYNSNVLVNVEDIDHFVDKHVGSTIPEEEQNIFIWEHKELLIAEWIHLSRNTKPLQAPRDVHDVSDSVLHDFFDPLKHNVSYRGGNDGDAGEKQVPCNGRDAV